MDNIIPIPCMIFHIDIQQCFYCHTSQTYTHVSYQQKNISKKYIFSQYAYYWRALTLRERLQSEFLVAFKNYAYYRGRGTYYWKRLLSKLNSRILYNR